VLYVRITTHVRLTIERSRRSRQDSSRRLGMMVKCQTATDQLGPTLCFSPVAFICSVLYCVIDGAHHQLCGSMSQAMMSAAAAANMQPYNTAAAAAAAAQSMIGSHHRQPQMPSQYAASSGSISLPAHQPPPRHSHTLVDNAYASVPGIPVLSLPITCTLNLFTIIDFTNHWITTI